MIRIGNKQARVGSAAGVVVIHGHSSHLPRPVEAYKGKPVLYGSGDLLNDYEGVRAYEAYRADLILLYLVSFNPARKELVRLDPVPM